MSQISVKMMLAVLIPGFVLGLAAALLIHRDAPPLEASFSSEDVTSSTSLSQVEREPLSQLGATDIGPVEEVLFLPEPDPPEIRTPIAVSVGGAVHEPDVYRFAEGRRVHHALEAAGGATPDADLEDINIAARLMDNTALYVPYRLLARREGHSMTVRRTPRAGDMNPARYTRSGWAHGPLAGAEPDHADNAPVDERTETPENVYGSTGELININTAPSAVLQQLPGIGPKTAEKIIDYRRERPFQQVDELREVHGIGEKKLEAVQALVTVY